MGYPKIKTFDKRLIERTLQNLDNYGGDFEFTHLINSLLTLIVLPHEYCKRGHLHLISDSFLKQKVFEIKEIRDFFVGCKELADESSNSYDQKRLILKSNTFNIKNEKALSLKELLSRLRNGIAHHNIRPARNDDIQLRCENSYWEGVIIRSYPPDHEKDAREWNENFIIEVYFDYQDLRTFSRFVAQKYLENIQDGNS